MYNKRYQDTSELSLGFDSSRPSSTSSTKTNDSSRRSSRISRSSDNSSFAMDTSDSYDLSNSYSTIDNSGNQLTFNIEKCIEF